MSQIVSVDKQINNILETINAYPEQLKRAAILAVNRTAEWLKGSVAKELSKNKRIKLKLIRDKITILKEDKRYIRRHLEFHLQDIPVMQLGGVKQNAIGTVAGGVLYPHAFIATLRKGVGKPNVYRRVGRERFPVKVVRVSIYEAAIKIIEDLLGLEATQVFKKRFLHEIKRITGAV